MLQPLRARRAAGAQLGAAGARGGLSTANLRQQQRVLSKRPSGGRAPNCSVAPTKQRTCHRRHAACAKGRQGSVIFDLWSRGRGAQLDLRPGFGQRTNNNHAPAPSRPPRTVGHRRDNGSGPRWLPEPGLEPDHSGVPAPHRLGQVRLQAGKSLGSSRQAVPNHSQHPLIEELLDLEPAKQACAEIGFENLRSDNETIILLSKYENAPPLYWHQVSAPFRSVRRDASNSPVVLQDLMNWGHASATTPWPSRVFLSYYTVDTNRENGCLRVIP